MRWNFTEEDALFWEAHPEIFIGNARVKGEERLFLYLMYNRIFNDSKKPSACGGCFRYIIDGINKAYKTYKQDNG